MDALPPNPPALVRRVCDENGCRLVPVRGFVNLPAFVPAAAPQPMPQAVVLPPLTRRVAEAVARPFRNFFIFAKSHRPRLFWR